MIEIHTWYVNANDREYKVIVAAEDNIAIDEEIIPIENDQPYPFDETTLLSFLYECASVKGDIREYQEWKKKGIEWIEDTIVRIECLSFEMHEGEA